MLFMSHHRLTQQKGVTSHTHSVTAVLQSRAFITTSGEVNHMTLSSTMTYNFTQCVAWLTRDNGSLDLAPSNALSDKDTCSIALSSLDRSDHNLATSHPSISPQSSNKMQPSTPPGEKHLKQIHSGKTAGPDSLSMDVLKGCAE